MSLNDPHTSTPQGPRSKQYISSTTAQTTAPDPIHNPKGVTYPTKPTHSHICTDLPRVRPLCPRSSKSIHPRGNGISNRTLRPARIRISLCRFLEIILLFEQVALDFPVTEELEVFLCSEGKVLALFLSSISPILPNSIPIPILIKTVPPVPNTTNAQNKT